MKKIIFLIFFVAIIGIFWSGGVKAGAGDNVSGYAWSENIGWVDFNCTNQGACGTSDFGVNINSNGTFSGYAWSENIGWVDFAPSGPYPSSPNYSACFDLQGAGEICDGIGTNNVGGWARVLSYSDGWDGWIKLRGANYGVSINDDTGDFSGYAWSDMVVGWINFNGVNYEVTTNFSFNEPPDRPEKAQETTWDHCIFLGQSIPTFYWTYDDPDDVPQGADPQTAYEIEVDENSGFSGTKFNHLVNGAGTAYALNLAQDDNSDWLSELDWNATYFWRVRVKDSHNNWSDWSSSQQFKTPQEAYPYSGFTWEPEEPVQKEVVVFTPDDLGLPSYLWTVTEGEATFTDGTGSTSEQPHIIFETSINKIKLEVTNGSYSCESTEQNISAQLPLPEYHETPPIIWLEEGLNNFASLLDGLYIFVKF